MGKCKILMINMFPSTIIVSCIAIAPVLWGLCLVDKVSRQNGLY